MLTFSNMMSSMLQKYWRVWALQKSQQAFYFYISNLLCLLFARQEVEQANVIFSLNWVYEVN